MKNILEDKIINFLKKSQYLKLNIFSLFTKMQFKHTIIDALVLTKCK